MREIASKNTAVATVIMLVGIACTALILPTDGPVNIFRTAAVGVGISLCIATFIESRSGVGGLIRTDMLMLWVLYALTLLEFLFPQPDVDSAVSATAASTGTLAVLLAFASLLIGRHLVPMQSYSAEPLVLAPNHLFSFFLVAFVLGYLHIFIAVSFDPFEMFRQMMLPRFSQSWSRGKFGGVYSLLYELGLLIYLLPPMAGLLFARAKEFTYFQRTFVTLVLALTFFYAIVGGTRNVLATYVVAMAGAYFLTKPDLRLKQLLMIGIPLTGVLAITTILMLEFRQIGFKNFSATELQYETLHVDHNIVNLSQLTDVFPNSVDYLGLEIPYHALIKPIPRALWSEKPEGLSTSIEAALGVTDNVTTLSCTFVGESYMAGGLLGVILAGLLFGAGAQLWNRVGRKRTSSFAQVLYASGFLCAAMAMRSMMGMVPFMLPTLALWLFGRVWLARSGRIGTPAGRTS